MSLHVFIGYDDREHSAFEVAAHSIKRHASIGLNIVPLNLGQLTKQGIFYRDHDPSSEHLLPMADKLRHHIIQPLVSSPSSVSTRALASQT